MARRQRRDLSVFESSCHLPICLPHTMEASHCPFSCWTPSREAVNTNFYSLWFDSTGNRTRVYRFSSRRSIHSTTDRLTWSITDRSTIFCWSFSCKPYDVNSLLMLNWFWVEKFSLQYALCDFNSILLHCTKLFIRLSVDREQIFDVTFEPPYWKILRAPLFVGIYNKFHINSESGVECTWKETSAEYFEYTTKLRIDLPKVGLSLYKIL